MYFILGIYEQTKKKTYKFFFLKCLSSFLCISLNLYLYCLYLRLDLQFHFLIRFALICYFLFQTSHFQFFNFNGFLVQCLFLSKSIYFQFSAATII